MSDLPAKEKSLSETKQPPAKKHRRPPEDHWKTAWGWKREHRPDKVRFERPYIYPLRLPSLSHDTPLIIHQQPFSAEGFASTVWDSSIVLAKFFEKYPGIVRGNRCLDLSAGCGLVGIVAAALGGDVVVTDLEPNIPLLKKNCDESGYALEVKEHTWGSEESVAAMSPPFDILAACDVMYISEAVPDLVKSLDALSGPQTRVFIAHGRNRGGESAFKVACDAVGFEIRQLESEELDDVYHTVDVDVLELTKRKNKKTKRNY